MATLLTGLDGHYRAASRRWLDLDHLPCAQVIGIKSAPGPNR
jgi:hypothetical protein